MIWARDENPSLVKMWVTCTSTVFSPTTSVAAISRLESPSATRAASSCSRAVSPPNDSGAGSGGAATPLHTYPGQVLVTMLEGENTFSVGGAEKVYKTGDGFVELPGEIDQAHNTGTSRMSVMATTCSRRARSCQCRRWRHVDTHLRYT